MTELKRCPFCGGESSVKSSRQPTNGGQSYMRGWVGCPQCGIYKQWTHDSSGAARIWNSREGGGS